MMLVLLVLSPSGNTLRFQFGNSNMKGIPVENNVYPKVPICISDYCEVE